VEKGFDFVGDAFNADDVTPIVAPDPIPDDCNGHGTHVAGIIGANGGLTGVAPGVTFHAYRVFGCEGSTTSDIMLAAMEMALENGADVLNMSIGSSFQWPDYPTAQGAARLVRHGIVVVAAIGNAGTSGLYAASAPGVGRDVIGVASFDNTHGHLPAFTISPDATAIAYLAAAGAPVPPAAGAFPMARTGTPTVTDDACSALPAGSLTGRVVLIRRGGCSFYEKAFNAQSAGAAGVVLYNNAAGFISPTVAGMPSITIPVVAITAARGALIDSRLASGPVTMTWTAQITTEPIPTGGLISSFSSYGPAPDLSFKPDLGAPGGMIRSTLPLEQGGYGAVSGTSMSSPHTAGAVALLLQARPDARPDEIHERLQNTARPALWAGNPSLGFLDNVHRQGAGLLRLDDAVLSQAVVSPGSLALGEVETGSVSKRLRLRSSGEREHDRGHGRKRSSASRDRGRGRGRGRNPDNDNDGDAVTYTLSHRPALATGRDTFTPSFHASFATVQFSRPTLTAGGDGDETEVLVTITPPAAAGPSRLFGGYIVLTPDDGSPVLRVPYAGYKGDYQAIPVLTPTPAGFPWLATLVWPDFVNEPAGALFTLQDDDVPFILLHLDHQSRQLKLEVFDVTTGRSLGFAEIDDFVVRNSSNTSFFAIPWDGTTMKRAGGKTRAVPNGTYRIEVSILKALGDPRNPAHAERWTSPDITIARPAPTTP
jgi:subtilisin family serine protease